METVEIPKEHLAERYALLDAMGPYYDRDPGPPPYGTPGSYKMSEFCDAITKAVKPK
jgi:hypothetical protein